ncbi:hypothetical protein OCOJLMKI_0073 [Methylobacterium iners]|uniref:Uncharacterized protein n=1 Tax=Methylobacterium iners TaxID=418707 RepID=A0ABQ4RRC4_9HYPH|nr:hypothetical protein OCOJLMKI_0073 [Methylobacterium iners]
MIDGYTKIVLTIIALSLSALALKPAILPAQAQLNGCGSSSRNPCYIEMSSKGCGAFNDPCYIRMDR